MLLFRSRFAHGSFKYESFLNRSIWPIVGTLTSPTTLGQSGLGSISNEEVHHRLEPHHQMHFSVIPKTPLLLLVGGGGLTPLLGIQLVYTKPHWQICINLISLFSMKSLLCIPFSDLVSFSLMITLFLFIKHFVRLAWIKSFAIF